jgi:hypothetical protein
MPSVKETSPEVRVLGHPVRKRLMELLGEKQSLSFSELRAETGLPVGTLYYHLDVLGDMIAQDHGRKYILTKDGLRFYSEMALKEGLPLPKQPRTTSFIPSWVFTRISSRPYLDLVIFVAVVVSGSYLSYAESDAILFMDFYRNQPGLVAAVSFPLAVLSYYVFGLVAALLSGRRSFSLPSLFATSVVYLPFLLHPVGLIGRAGAGATLLEVAAQLVSVILGTGYLTSAYGFRLERSLLIQLVIFMVSTVAFFLIQYGLALA